MPGAIRVLIVDDSAFMRRVIRDLLESEPGITVVDTARDGREGVAKCLALQPDVVTMDVEMPRLDGFGALRELVQHRPTPVVMVSNHTRAGTEATIRALTLGAVDFVTKPSGAISLDMHRVRDELVAKVQAAATATPRPRTVLADLPSIRLRRRLAAAGLQAGPSAPLGPAADRVVVIGCSTGGPGALHHVIPRLPAQLGAAVLVVQHMPPGFTASLARRLGELSALTVREAGDGDRLAADQVLVAPGWKHLVVQGEAVRLTEDPPLHGVRPAVDLTLASAAAQFGNRTLAVVLTGMGADGARGAAAVKQAGGHVIAEAASTCVVFGMPKAVVERGLADQILPVHEIAGAIARFAPERRAAGE